MVFLAKKKKQKKLSIDIEFSTFELAKVPYFNLDIQFNLFGPNLPKKCISSLKQKKVKMTIELGIFELV